MKQIEVKVQFPTVSIEEFKEYYVYDPNFQRKVQEDQLHKEVVVSDWTLKTRDTKKTMHQRTVNFYAPVNAPSAVKKFLNMEYVQGISYADYLVFAEDMDRCEGSTVMNMLTGVLKDKLIITLHWKVTALADKRGCTLHVTIKCEFKKSIPVLSPLIENAAVANAQKNYDCWISSAKKVAAAKFAQKAAAEKVA
jgi:hypothetical protein